MDSTKLYLYSILHIITDILELFIDITLYLIGTIEILVETLEILNIPLDDITKPDLLEELNYIYQGLCITHAPH